MRRTRRNASQGGMSQADRRTMILGVVENQLRENDPPETRATLERLLADGTNHDEAMRLIGCVLSVELFDILRSGSEFDLSRYVRRLQDLPAMPWDTEGR